MHVSLQHPWHLPSVIHTAHLTISSPSCQLPRASSREAPPAASRPASLSPSAPTQLSTDSRCHAAPWSLASSAGYPLGAKPPPPSQRLGSSIWFGFCTNHIDHLQGRLGRQAEWGRCPFPSPLDSTSIQDSTVSLGPSLRGRTLAGCECAHSPCCPSWD